MPRVIWQGAISFGLVHIPVGLYNAEKRKELSFSMLDRRNMAPVGYKRVNKETGDEVPWEEIVKGYEYEDNRYVVLTDEDLKAANPKATQTVDIVDFVDAAAIDPQYFEAPYYLAPGKRGEKGYALLREVLKRTGKVGIARVVIRTRQHVAALMPVGSVLVLDLLRYADELRSPAELDLPAEDLAAVGVNERELEMAQRLVEGMLVEWRPDKYRDDYRQDLLAMIERKITTGETHVVAEEVGGETQGAEVIDMMALLKRSLDEQGKGGRAEPKAKAPAKPAAEKAPAKGKAKTATAAPKGSRERKRA